MASTRKPRSDSRLKTLPEERQRHVIELMRTRSLAEVRKELRADGITTSSAALSDFFSWWHLREQFRGWEEDTATMLELLKRDHPELSEEELAGYGNAMFQLRAIKEQDVEAYTALMTARHRAVMDERKLKLRERELALKERRLRLLEAKAEQADKAKALLGEGGLTPEEREQRMRQVFGL